jgi:hypothetical protein
LKNGLNKSFAYCLHRYYTLSIVYLDLKNFPLMGNSLFCIFKILALMKFLSSDNDYMPSPASLTHYFEVFLCSLLKEYFKIFYSLFVVGRELRWMFSKYFTALIKRFYKNSPGNTEIIRLASLLGFWNICAEISTDVKVDNERKVRENYSLLIMENWKYLKII